ncbi:MAG: hypothetical protein JWM41_1142 [Gemmatimonadetes bacterium]|nr:hypothetical protein [Gemmatimonadota bacterium]
MDSNGVCLAVSTGRCPHPLAPAVFARHDPASALRATPTSTPQHALMTVLADAGSLSFDEDIRMSPCDAYKTQFFRTNDAGRRVATPFGPRVVVDAAGIRPARERDMCSACQAVRVRRAWRRRGVRGASRLAPPTRPNGTAHGDARRGPASCRPSRTARCAQRGVWRRRFWAFVVASVLIAVIGFALPVAPPFTEGRSLGLTLTGARLALFGALFAIAAFRALRSTHPSF